ncbi:hypothetical protein [Streptacidiphilus sp. EB103A]|uniref:hypothetical protein n=1 Tax=Streptacidiphilus sp. EB103A TaxID=3156275 RepID=UPI00351206FA
MSTAANIGGLGVGPLVSGILAQYLGAPLRMPYLVFGTLLLIAVAAVALTPETVGTRSLKPLPRPQRISVDHGDPVGYISACAAGFAAFAVFGLFTSVAPGFISGTLPQSSRALAGLVVFSVVLRRRRSRTDADGPTQRPAARPCRADCSGRGRDRPCHQHAHRRPRRVRGCRDRRGWLLSRSTQKSDIASWTWSTRSDVAPPTGLKPLATYKNTDPAAFVAFMHDRAAVERLRSQLQLYVGQVQGPDPADPTNTLGPTPGSF